MCMCSTWTFGILVQTISAGQCLLKVVIYGSQVGVASFCPANTDWKPETQTHLK